MHLWNLHDYAPVNHFVGAASDWRNKRPFVFAFNLSGEINFTRLLGEPKFTFFPKRTHRVAITFDCASVTLSFKNAAVLTFTFPSNFSRIALWICGAEPQAHFFLSGGVYWWCQPQQSENGSQRDILRRKNDSSLFLEGQTSISKQSIKGSIFVKNNP